VGSLLEKRKLFSLVAIVLILTSGAITVWIISENKDDFMVVDSYAEVSKDHFIEGEEVVIAIWPNNTNYAFRVNVNLGIFRIPDEVEPSIILNDSNLRNGIKTYDAMRSGLYGEVKVKDFTHESGVRSAVWNGTVLVKSGLLFNTTSNDPIYVNAPAGYYFIYPLDEEYYDRSEKHFVHFDLTEGSVFYYGGLDFKVSYVNTSGGVEYTIFAGNEQLTAQTIECHVEGRIYYSEGGDKISEDFVLTPGTNATYRMACDLPFFNQGNSLSVMVLVRTSIGDYYFSENIYGNMGKQSWEASL
jgi:hypothetical protein